MNSSESAGRFGVSFCQFKLPPGAVRCKDIRDRQNDYVFVSFLGIKIYVTFYSMMIRSCERRIIWIHQFIGN